MKKFLLVVLNVFSIVCLILTLVILFEVIIPANRALEDESVTALTTIEKLNAEILENKKEIDELEKEIGEYLRTIYENEPNAITFLQIVFENESISQIFYDIKIFTQIQKENEKRILRLKELNKSLREQKKVLKTRVFNWGRRGVLINYDGRKITWYSQSVLHGGGLSIPGRHIENGYVCDGDGYICGSGTLLEKSKGAIIDTVIGEVKVYDVNAGSNRLDIYVS